MKRRNPVKTLETSELVLARMREQRARLEADIASLEQRHEADVQQFVMDAVKRLNLTQVPAATLLGGLEQLAKSARVDRPVVDPGGTDADSSGDPQEELVPVIVRLTRNTSAVNRANLENAGVRWNGRARGWTGRVAPDALQHLSEIFPGRVERPNRKSSAAQQDDKAGPALEAEALPVTPPDPPPANVEAEAVATTEDGASNDTAAEEGAIAPAQPEVSAATRLLTPQYRPALPRRPLPT